MIRRQIDIINRLGLHARAATKLVSCASGFGAEIFISRDGKSVNGKSIMGVLTLAAAQGSTLQIEADGPDEQQAIDALVELVEGRFGEDE